MVFSRTLARPRGGEMEMDYFGIPLLDSEGNIRGAMKVIMDQTEIRSYNFV